MRVLFVQKPCTIRYRIKPLSIRPSRLVPLAPWYTDGTRRFIVCSRRLPRGADSALILGHAYPSPADAIRKPLTHAWHDRPGRPHLSSSGLVRPSGGVTPARGRAEVNTAFRTLLRHLSTPLRFHIPLHFEARQQFDIAGGAVDVGFLVALLFCAGSKLCPFRLNGVARLRLFFRAPFLLLIRAACGLAYSRDIEFRRGVRDRDGVQGS